MKPKLPQPKSEPRGYAQLDLNPEDEVILAEVLADAATKFDLAADPDGQDGDASTAS
jgi:hypothetical protein